MDNEQIDPITQVTQEPPVNLVPPIQATFSLPSATEIFKQAWAIYKQRLGTFLGVMAIPMLSMLVVMAIFTIFLGGSFLLSPLFTSNFQAKGIGFFIFAISFSIIAFVVTFIAQAWGQAALIYAIKDSQEKIGVKESYRRGWHMIISYWWVSLLAGIIAIGGFLLLVIPGIIFAIWFSMATFVLIAEDLKGMNAILKSKEYVKGKTGAVLWRGIFIGIISLIISVGPILAVTLLKVPYGPDIIGLAASLFLTPLLMIYSFLIYTHLKNLKGEIVFTPTGGKKVKFILIGILGFLIIPTMIFLSIFLTLGPAKQKAHDMQRYTDISTIQWGINVYYSENGNYPSSLNELSSKYLPVMPVDPKTNQPYQYQLQADKLGYKVCAQLETTKAEKCVSRSSDFSEPIGDLSSFYSIKSLRVTDKTLESIGLTAENFPLLDGATASQPIRSLIACEVFNIECTWYENESREMFLNPDFYSSNSISYADQDKIRSKIDKNSKTHDAYIGLIQDKVDLILVSTKPSDDELKEAEKLGVKLELVPIGLDGFIFLVNEKNPINNLNTSDIVGIYSGQIKNWKDIPGAGALSDIVAFTRPVNSGSQELMNKLIMKGVAMDPNLKEERVIMAMAPLIEGVEKDKNAIGYSLYYYKNNMIDKRNIRPNVKLISIDGIEPNPENISSNKYPHRFMIYAVTRTDEPKNSPSYQIKEWLTSKQGQELIEKAGYIGLSN